MLKKLPFVSDYYCTQRYELILTKILSSTSLCSSLARYEQEEIIKFVYRYHNEYKTNEWNWNERNNAVSKMRIFPRVCLKILVYTSCFYCKCFVTLLFLPGNIRLYWFHNDREIKDIEYSEMQTSSVSFSIYFMIEHKFWR